MIDGVYTLGTRLPRAAAPFYPDMLWRMPDAASRVAYFTFDDGPTPTLTPRLIDILARFDAPATFFLLGQHAVRDPGLVRALADAGHTLGNHSFSHPDAWKTPAATVLDEMERTTDLLEDVTGHPIRWMRPPYGRFTRAIRRWCRDRGQRCTMWDTAPGDFLASATQPLIERRLLKAIRPGSIIVLHDNPKARNAMPPALVNVLTRLRDEGWRFAAL